MTVSDHWDQVENARCRLEQLSSLMSVYGNEFLDLSKEEFVQHAAGLEVNMIKDVTPIPHNGCRPPKRRRV